MLQPIIRGSQPCKRSMEIVSHSIAFLFKHHTVHISGDSMMGNNRNIIMIKPLKMNLYLSFYSFKHVFRELYMYAKTC